jgi:hypothetical protein
LGGLDVHGEIEVAVEDGGFKVFEFICFQYLR